MTDDRIQVRIGLPLPLDVSNTVTSLIGRAYPSTQMVLGTYDQMVLLIDPNDRQNRQDLTDEEVAEATLPFSDGVVESVGDEGMRFSTPEEAGVHLAEICKAMLDVEATNYVEVEVEDKATGKRYVVVACRSLGQTPHALRQQAENAKEMAVEQLRQTTLHLQTQMEGHGRYIAQTIMAMCSSAHEQPCSTCPAAAHIAETTPPKETA